MKFSQAFASPVAGVLYAVDFDEPTLEFSQPPEKHKVEPEAVEPSFTLEDLRGAVDTAREEGRRAERQVLMASLETRRLAVLTTLADELRRAHEQSTRVTEDALEQLSATVLATVVAALPGLCAQHATSEISLLLRNILPPLRQTRELQIRIHPSVRAAVEQSTADLLADADASVSWIESEALAPGDVAVRWSSGEANRDTRGLCEQIRATLLALFPSLAVPPPVSLSAETSDVQ